MFSRGAKICFHGVPMWLTFSILGVVISIGKTYFLEQANHMSRKVGSIKVTLPIFLLFHEWAKEWFTGLYLSLASLLQISKSKTKYASPIGLAVAMVCSTLCCITAAKVESRRLNVIERHGLRDKPTETIPMNIFWLLPQFLLLALVDGISENSILDFFEGQAPSSMKEYLKFFTNGVLGLGIMFNVLLVYIVGKISERGGRQNWFQESLNKSRLDNYYWTLAGLSAVNLVFFILVAVCYPYKNYPLAAEKTTGNAETTDQSQEENVQCCC